MSAQMIASGWEIKLVARGKTYEYRRQTPAQAAQLNGGNHIVEQ